MKTLFDALRPFTWILSIYGIFLEKKSDETKWLKSVKIVIIFIWTGLNFKVMYTAIDFVFVLAHVLKRKHSENCIYIVALFSQFTIGLTIILLSIIQYRTIAEDYSEILKKIEISQKVFRMVRCKVLCLTVLFIFVLLPLIVQQVYFGVLFWNEMSMEILCDLLSEFQNQLLIYFTGVTCSIIIAIGYFVTLQLSDIEFEFRTFKSNHRSAVKVRIAMIEYDKLCEMSVKFDDLFAPMIYVLLWAHGISAIEKLCTLNMNYSAGLITYVIVNLAIVMTYYNCAVTVFYTLYSAVVNQKIKSFLKNLLFSQLENKSLMPIELTHDHLTHLIWTMEHLIKSDNEWFTLGFGLTFDMDILFALIQTAYCVSMTHNLDFTVATFLT
ncbi:hypothetical protein CHUAL_011349 [Chamberlinius hualienensis]